MTSRCRIFFRLSVFLLFGVMVNVAVAWGCAMWSPLRTSQDPDLALNPTLSGGWSERHGSPREFVLLTQFDGFGRVVRRLTGASQKYDEEGNLVYFVDGRWVQALSAPSFEPREYEVMWEETGFRFHRCRRVTG